MPIRAAAPNRTIAMNSRTSQSQKGSSLGGSPMPPISPDGISAGAISATSSEWEPRENRKRRNFSNRSPMGLRIPASHSNCVLSTRMPTPAKVYPRTRPMPEWNISAAGRKPALLLFMDRKSR